MSLGIQFEMQLLSHIKGQRIYKCDWLHQVSECDVEALLLHASTFVFVILYFVFRRRQRILKTQAAANQPHLPPLQGAKWKSLKLS